MELTKEHFDQVLKNLATKKDLDAGLAASEKRIVKRIDEDQEELARMVAHQAVKAKVARGESRSIGLPFLFCSPDS